MTHLSNGTIVTEIDASTDNATLTAQGYTIHHIETWHRDEDHSFIVWECPAISDADVPF